MLPGLQPSGLSVGDSTRPAGRTAGMSFVFTPPSQLTLDTPGISFCILETFTL